MTVTTPTEPAPAPAPPQLTFAQRHRGAAARAGLIVVAVGLNLLPIWRDEPLWTGLRLLIALPVIVGVLGESAVALLLGPPLGRPSRDPAGTPGPDPAAGDDRHLRVLLVPVFAVIGILVAVFVLQAVGLRLTTTVAPVAIGVETLVVLGLLVVRAERGAARPADAGHAGPGSTTVQPSVPTTRAQARRERAGRGARNRLLAAAGPALGVAAAGLLLAGAVYGAKAMQPQQVERFTQLQLDEPAVLRGQPLTAEPGRQLQVRWSLRSTNWNLDGRTPQVTVTVGGSPATGVVVQAGPPVPARSTSGTTVEQDCSVRLTAPTRPGLYRVDLSVVVPGAPQASPLLATLDLTVTSRGTP